MAGTLFATLGDIEPARMGLNGDRLDGANRPNRFQALADLRKRHPQFSRRDRRELVQHLDADPAPCRNQLFRPLRLCRVRGQQIKQNVGIEKLLTSRAHALRGDQT